MCPQPSAPNASVVLTSGPTSANPTFSEGVHVSSSQPQLEIIDVIQVRSTLDQLIQGALTLSAFEDSYKNGKMEQGTYQAVKKKYASELLEVQKEIEHFNDWVQNKENKRNVLLMSNDNGDTLMQHLLVAGKFKKETMENLQKHSQHFSRQVDFATFQKNPDEYHAMILIDAWMNVRNLMKDKAYLSVIRYINRLEKEHKEKKGHYIRDKNLIRVFKDYTMVAYNKIANLQMTSSDENWIKIPGNRERLENLKHDIYLMSPVKILKKGLEGNNKIKTWQKSEQDLWSSLFETFEKGDIKTITALCEKHLKEKNLRPELKMTLLTMDLTVKLYTRKYDQIQLDDITLDADSISDWSQFKALTLRLVKSLQRGEIEFSLDAGFEKYRKETEASFKTWIMKEENLPNVQKLQDAFKNPLKSEFVERALGGTAEKFPALKELERLWDTQNVKEALLWIKQHRHDYIPHGGGHFILHLVEAHLLWQQGDRASCEALYKLSYEMMELYSGNPLIDSTFNPLEMIAKAKLMGTHFPVSDDEKEFFEWVSIRANKEQLRAFQENFLELVSSPLSELFKKALKEQWLKSATDAQKQQEKELLPIFLENVLSDDLDKVILTFEKHFPFVEKDSRLFSLMRFVYTVILTKTGSHDERILREAGNSIIAPLTESTRRALQARLYHYNVNNHSVENEQGNIIQKGISIAMMAIGTLMIGYAYQGSIRMLFRNIETEKEELYRRINNLVEFKGIEKLPSIRQGISTNGMRDSVKNWTSVNGWPKKYTEMHALIDTIEEERNELCFKEQKVSLLATCSEINKNTYLSGDEKATLGNYIKSLDSLKYESGKKNSSKESQLETLDVKIKDLKKLSDNARFCELSRRSLLKKLFSLQSEKEDKNGSPEKKALLKNLDVKAEEKIIEELSKDKNGLGIIEKEEYIHKLIAKIIDIQWNYTHRKTLLKQLSNLNQRINKLSLKELPPSFSRKLHDLYADIEKESFLHEKTLNEFYFNEKGIEKFQEKKREIEKYIVKKEESINEQIRLYGEFYEMELKRPTLKERAAKLCEKAARLTGIGSSNVRKFADIENEIKKGEKFEEKLKKSTTLSDINNLETFIKNLEAEVFGVEEAKKIKDQYSKQIEESKTKKVAILNPAKEEKTEQEKQTPAEIIFEQKSALTDLHKTTVSVEKKKNKHPVPKLDNYTELKEEITKNPLANFKELCVSQGLKLGNPASLLEAFFSQIEREIKSNNSVDSKYLGLYTDFANEIEEETKRTSRETVLFYIFEYLKKRFGEGVVGLDVSLFEKSAIDDSVKYVGFSNTPLSYKVVNEKMNIPIGLFYDAEFGTYTEISSDITKEAEKKLEKQEVLLEKTLPKKQKENIILPKRLYKEEDVTTWMQSVDPLLQKGDAITQAKALVDSKDIDKNHWLYRLTLTHLLVRALSVSGAEKNKDSDFSGYQLLNYVKHYFLTDITSLEAIVQHWDKVLLRDLKSLFDVKEIEKLALEDKRDWDEKNQCVSSYMEQKETLQKAFGALKSMAGLLSKIDKESHALWILKETSLILLGEMHRYVSFNHTDNSWLKFCVQLRNEFAHYADEELKSETLEQINLCLSAINSSIDELQKRKKENKEHSSLYGKHGFLGGSSSRNLLPSSQSSSVDAGDPKTTVPKLNSK